ncbi:MAG: sulfite exporter TauE/SafE family protein, partial [Pseudomonadota bacterium]
PSLKVLLPGAAAGVLVGWLTAAYVSETHVRLIIGLVAIAFVMNAWFQGAITPRPAGAERASTQATAASSTDRAGGAFWGSVAGFTSFVSHAGGPPFQVHMLPKCLAPRLLAGTSVIFFFVTNQMKLIPYWALGQFSAENLTTSAVLFPVALVAVGMGVWLVKVVRPETFYRVIYLVLFIVGIRLVWTSLSALATA